MKKSGKCRHSSIMVTDYGWFTLTGVEVFYSITEFENNSHCLKKKKLILSRTLFFNYFMIDMKLVNRKNGCFESDDFLRI